MRAVPVTPRQVMFTVCGQCPSLHAEGLTITAIVILAIVPARAAFFFKIYWFEYIFYLHFVTTTVILRNHNGPQKKNSFLEANNHSASREVSHHLMEHGG